MAGLDYNQAKEFIINAQQALKKIKQNPLNPNLIKKEKIKELIDERERFKNLYVSESIKNKDFNEAAGGGATIMSQRLLNSAAGGRSNSNRPMTTVSSMSSLRGGGIFMTQLSRRGNRLHNTIKLLN